MSHLFTMVRIIVLMTCFLWSSNPVGGQEEQVPYIGIGEFYRTNGVPGLCGHVMNVEGKVARIRGFVDRSNIFDKKHYPNLPYEKFKVDDGKTGNSIEVWAVSEDNSAIFEKILRNTTLENKKIFVSGVVSGFDMPIMGSCRRGLRLEVKDPDNFFFK
jgi:hypothetical protein